MRCAQSVPKECQMTTQEHPTPTKTKGRNASKTLTFRPLFDHDKRFLSPVRLPVPPPRHVEAKRTYSTDDIQAYVAYTFSATTPRPSPAPINFERE